MDVDLRDLLAAWLSDADPGEPRRAALLGRLRDDAAFREAFVAEVRLLGMLRAVQSAEPRWLRLEDLIGWSARERAADAALADRVVRHGRARARLRTAGRRALLAAAALAAGLLLVAVFRPRQPLVLSPSATAAAPEALARAVKLDGVVWDQGQAGAVEGEGVPAGRLRLRAGRVTLAFFGGATLTAEGPADIDLVGRDRVFCRHGKLRVRVGPGGEGFTVGAPGSEVVDLGTEFGLNLEPGGKARLMVFEGEAAVSVLGNDGRPLRSALIEGSKSVEVDPGAAGIREVPAKPETFVRLPDAVPPALDLDPGYPAAVLAARPWGYWRFDRLDGQVAANEVAGRPALYARGGVRLDGEPGRNRWAVFDAGDHTQALILDGTWTPPRATGYAIELWVQAADLSPDVPGQTALVSAIASPEGEDEEHISYLELTARSRRSPHEPCAVRFLDRWPAATRGGVNAFSRRTFIPYQWHHVVGQKAGPNLEVYVDGELVGSSPTDAAGDDGRATTGPCRLVVGRLKQWSVSGNGIEVRPFEGRLDELAVYDRPLTADEIRQHFRLRTAGGGAP
jgi:hypothetical protein